MPKGWQLIRSKTISSDMHLVCRQNLRRVRLPGVCNMANNFATLTELLTYLASAACRCERDNLRAERYPTVLAQLPTCHCLFDLRSIRACAKRSDTSRQRRPLESQLAHV